MKRSMMGGASRFTMAALAALALAAGTSAADSAAGSDPHAQLRDFVCQRALDPPARAVQVEAVMKPISGTRKMRLRFELLMKPKGQQSYSEVRGGDLGTWISPSNPTLGQRPGDQWIVKKQVVDLQAPALYRFRVSFRWIGNHGRVLSTMTRLSPTCYQPELRPDLRVSSITVESVSGKPQLNRYVALIRNAGATDAGAFYVRFADGGTAKNHKVQSLASHSSIHESFVGPKCAYG